MTTTHGLPLPHRRPPLQRPPVQHGPAPTMTLPPTLSTSGAHAAAETMVLPRRTPAAPIPRITVAVVLASSAATGANWDRAVREIRKAMDLRSAHYYETHSCGAEGNRRTSWYAEMPGTQAPEVRADLEHFADYWREWARVTWAPCSPIDL